MKADLKTSYLIQPPELALDRYVCYPMESVTLFIRVRVPDVKTALLNIKIPQTGKIYSVSLDGVSDNDLSVYFSGENSSLLTIPVHKYLSAGEIGEVSVNVRLASLVMDHYLTFSCWLSSVEDRIDEMKIVDGVPSRASRVRLAVKVNADYLRFLPELYSYDEFMNRFLMFFESFWKPINQQIAQAENYFDPDMTPETFLPWLGSWLGLKIDDSFPKERIRSLIKSAIDFYHCRGTLHSLELYLGLYSGGTVHVIERKARNMVLGKEAYLGDGIALGSENFPNTVCITLKASADELTRTGFSKETYHQKICELIKGIVPAYTVFTLDCQFS